jgi:hypothetical protein
MPTFLKDKLCLVTLVGGFASLETLDKAVVFLHSFEGNWKACRKC